MFSLILTVVILISLFVSFWIYDLSNLYTLDWLGRLNVNSAHKIVNINAGFDETSILLQAKYPGAVLAVFDFYDPVNHTEVSIKRARKVYPAYKNTVQITTSALPLQNNTADYIFVILAAHEIRQDAERIQFFRELNRTVKDSGKIIVTEHLRDLPNFLAYNIGFFHFLTGASWQKTFKCSGLSIYGKVKITPFITTYFLEKNGISS
jgi:SAM-dependent methyltransferase